MDELSVKLTEEQILEMIRLLNRTYEYPFQWISQRSQKEHIDQFGRPINNGETYWHMRMGGSYNNDLKLSQASMERLLFVLFAPQPKWELDSIAARQQEMQKVRNIMDELRPKRN